MARTAVHHPLFARLYARMSPGAERHGVGEHREELLAGIAGRVLEVGAGNGLNFAHYPEAVSEVVAVEPEPYLRERAAEAALHARVPVSVVDGTAEALPVPDASADVGVASLVLCSVRDQDAALAELMRAIRPGGELRFYEHVIAPPGWGRRMQKLSDATWYPLVAGGCHLTRDTVGAIERAGFRVESRRSFPFAPAPVAPKLPMELGLARRP